MYERWPEVANKEKERTNAYVGYLEGKKCLELWMEWKIDSGLEAFFLPDSIRMDKCFGNFYFYFPTRFAR